MIKERHIKKLFTSGNIEEIKINDSLTFVSINGNFQLYGLAGVHKVLYSVSVSGGLTHLTFLNSKLEILVSRGWFE